MLHELRKYLRTLQRKYSFVVWHDGEIEPGKEWAKEIDTHLSQADIVLLLVSQDFIASDYCNREMEQALERHSKGEARVIPIILSPSTWEDEQALHGLQALPTGGEAITLWSNRNAAFVDVARGIQKVVDRLTGNNNPG